jgi:UDP-N-acetylglucosamine--N-acetylmuramyl-(pentapeptide) pyrophosphoryl-undecaprenol N-acetylglucosamine transferase
MSQIVLAGGGTTGHIAPLIATAQALAARQPGAGLVVVGTKRGLETSVVPKAGLDLQLIPAVPLSRQWEPSLLTLPPRLLAAAVQSARIIKRHRGEVVVGFGGYASLPVYLAARWLKIPVVVHEQNALPGLANRVAARFARTVAVTFPDTDLPGAVQIGLPLRPAIAGLDRQAARPAARSRFDLSAEGPVVLVSGGSQGARSLNHAIEAAAPALLAAGISILQVTGPGHEGETSTVSTAAATGGAVHRQVAYVDAMEEAYAAADLMVARSGAGTVVEVAAVGLPAIFVPLPHGNGEQARNAAGLVAAGGGEVILDSELTGDLLAGAVRDLIDDPTRLQTMAQAGQDLMPRDSADRLARIVLSAALGRGAKRGGKVSVPAGSSASAPDDTADDPAPLSEESAPVNDDDAARPSATATREGVGDAA